MFSDLHCHPTGRNFTYYSNYDREIYDENKYHPWNIRNSKGNSLRKGKRATSYDQCDFARIIDGKVKLVFAALYPFEHGFFNVLRKTPLGDGSKYTDHFDLSASPPGATLKTITGNTISRLAYIRSNGYSYWQELQDEYDYIIRQSGVKNHAIIELDQNEDPDDIRLRKQKVSGKYFLFAENPNNGKKSNYGHGEVKYKKVSEANFNNNDETYVVLTIEGMHALSMENQAICSKEGLIFDRIKVIKSWDPPIFFMTFAHHFDNNLCSHAHSFFEIKILDSWNPDQTKNMNFWGNFKGNTTNPDNQIRYRGFSDLGVKVLCELLNIEKSGNGFKSKLNNGRRILIDTKHMSASSRLDFYKTIEKYNSGNGDKIPVISSHSAYSGIRTLKSLIKRYDNEYDDYDPELISEYIPNVGFNPWNINLCDEDIQFIIKTKGLIGLSFDERILGASKSWVKRYGDDIPGIKLLVNNLIGMAEAAREINKHHYSENGNDYTFWDCITIGTDFNGVIDPVNPYPTCEQFEDFKTHLKVELKNSSIISGYGINDSNIDEVVKKFCFSNAWSFVQKHF